MKFEMPNLNPESNEISDKRAQKLKDMLTQYELILHGGGLDKIGKYKVALLQTTIADKRFNPKKVRAELESLGEFDPNAFKEAEGLVEDLSGLSKAA